MADDGPDRKPDGPSAGAVAAAAVLVSAVALPVLGLRFLFGGSRTSPAAAPAPDPVPDETAPAAPPEPVAPGAARTVAVSLPDELAGPARGDVEAALGRLADATVAPRRRPRRKVAKSVRA